MAGQTQRSFARTAAAIARDFPNAMRFRARAARVDNALGLDPIAVRQHHRGGADPQRLLRDQLAGGEARADDTIEAFGLDRIIARR